jgi:hypothetical protein
VVLLRIDSVLNLQPDYSFKFYLTVPQIILSRKSQLAEANGFGDAPQSCAVLVFAFD